MNRIDVIKLVGDAITEIDILLGSNIPNDVRNTLEFQRNVLDSAQLLLVKNQFNDTTPLYIQATKELKDVNDAVKATLNEITKIIETMNNITRLVNSVTTVLKVIGLIF